MATYNESVTVLSSRLRLGEILVRDNILTPETVEEMATIAHRNDKRIGTVLEEYGLITEGELAQALAIQFGYRMVEDFAERAVPPPLLTLVPGDVARNNQLFPLRLDHDRLELALADPTNTRAIETLVTSLKIAITPVIATRREIARAISRHYPPPLHEEECRKTILVVDDDTTILAMLTHLFTDEYEVLTATNGLEAYQLAIRTPPHLILTDMQMPEMNGYEFLGELREHDLTKAIPVILMSAGNGEDFEKNALARGFFDFIPKPFKVTSFKDKVRRATELM